MGLRNSETSPSSAASTTWRSVSSRAIKTDRRWAPGTAVLFGGKSLLDYKGSFLWKMTAGMGDIVFAPLYQALRRRGVEFEFFHRVDQLHPSRRRQSDRRDQHRAPGDDSPQVDRGTTL